jgi:DNA-binding NarL/FixJ family response regulator
VKKSAPVRVLIADDDPIIREVLRRMLRSQRNTKVIGEAADGNEAVNLTEKLKPDVLLLDLLMPHLPGMDTLRKLASAAAFVRTVVLTGFIGKRQIVEGLQLGARGILLKQSINYLVPCIEAVAEGYYWIENRKVRTVVEIIRELLRTSQPELDLAQRYRLTKREMQIMSLVTLANSNREIADTLSISEQTVKRHLVNMFDKTGMSTRLELAMFAIDRHLVSL